MRNERVGYINYSTSDVMILSGVAKLLVAAG